MANIIEVLTKYDGVARAKHIAAAGVSDFQLKTAMASGAVLRVAYGVYAVPGADPQLIAIRSLPAEPACVTAALLGGLWVLDAPQRTTRGNHAQPKLPGLRVPQVLRAAEATGCRHPKPALLART
ncbi:type IV toxin-antitoxin system AbiEi family antitoxin domain-containing protein [Arthrobacter sp. PM3]|uniref:type IV toxin-antitoxin system AbiEi family antitoxin domain-containing protein n=1 Tax=Arthrobacter sp. PM3 TaxID=2017685 RepID=UPI001ABFA974|nr:type IV toxin-antitoxin system AbiEi family antitoxin domain-containing protein [Arthrobacter sp. PM3]